ncbi:AmmeMemoRadiSam system protein B [Thermophagus sp. OGC60D27]|uniref:AmmeMemoRadiSam system protein B n=1 Tax=Thermophagus sp. OGC60D27 TaxID=3458415 RepID=UPI0040379FBD
MEIKDREPVVAGIFYEGNPVALKEDLGRLFDDAKPPVGEEEIMAVIVPHAGYIYSGVVAASAFNQIPEDADYETVFLIGSSHRMAFDGASVYTNGDYLTPLGRVEVDKALAKKLVDSSPFITGYSTPHLEEHSLEVELPFLQYRLKKPFKLVPVVMGPRDAKGAEHVAKALKPYFKPGNLFVVSTDFSHYPAYEDASKVDRITANAILKNNPRLLMQTLEENDKLGVERLATSLCGWTSVLTLLHVTEELSGLHFRHIEYRNSGDVEFGDSSSVVGYHAITISRNPKTKMEVRGFSLNENEKSWLLLRARKVLEWVVRGEITKAPEGVPPERVKVHTGAFVSLYKEGQLRGCVGQFGSSEPLWKVVDRMTKSAALDDTRFLSVKEDELDDIRLEISVLTPMKKIKELSEIIPGRHGIVVEKGRARGTFLPQVANKTGWGREELLGYCARDKAGIGWDGWKEADIFIYEAMVFGES